MTQSPRAEIELRFLGAANTVTGSCLYLRTPGGQMVVDCGLFQGPKALQGLNYAALPFDPVQLDAVILTHAHIDHAGLFPRLVTSGFHRRAHATPASCDLLRWVLTDAGAIHESEAERLNRRNAKRDQASVVALYTRADAEHSLARLAPTPLETWFEPMPGLRARLQNAGHILGSARVELEINGRIGDRPLRIIVSGDLGPREKALAFDPTPPTATDVLVIEGTYGDRARAPSDEASRLADLAREVRDALQAGGNLLIPAFAVERSQELIHDLLVLSRRREIPSAPIFLDSPLAHRATAIFQRHASELEIDGAPADAFSGSQQHVVESVEQRALDTFGKDLVAQGLAPEHLFQPELDERFAFDRADGGVVARRTQTPAGEGRADAELRRALAVGRDWHNEYAAAALALRRILVDAPNDATRQAILQRVEAALHPRQT